jgi:hypothetical protein
MNSRRFIRITFAAILAFAVPVMGALPASVKPYADKFEAERAALEATKELQLKPARERYLAALANAQRAATAAAKTTDIAAIASEIQGANVNSLTPEMPPDLPRTLTQERRAFVTVAANVARTVPQRQRELAAKYLQTLGALEANAFKAKDTALAEAIAAEKQRVIPFMEAAGGGQRNRNIIANSDFSTGEPGRFPPEWRQQASDVSVSDATIVTEGTEKFVRFRRLQALRRANLVPEKELPIPARSKWAEFSFRMRVKGYVAGTEWDPYPGIKFSARDARGEEISSEWGQIKQDTGWKRFTGRVAIPPEGKTLRVAMGPHGAAGVIDFDDLVVEFR